MASIEITAFSNGRTRSRTVKVRGTEARVVDWTDHAESPTQYEEREWRRQHEFEKQRFENMRGEADKPLFPPTPTQGPVILKEADWPDYRTPPVRVGETEKVPVKRLRHKRLGSAMGTAFLGVVSLGHVVMVVLRLLRDGWNNELLVSLFFAALFAFWFVQRWEFRTVPVDRVKR